MYNVIVEDVTKKRTNEKFEDYFTAKMRAKFLYLQGFKIKIAKNDKVIQEFFHI